MKLSYGIFLKEKINVDWDNWDNMPIGFHISTNRRLRENSETARYEYFYVDENDRVYIIDKPTMAEAAWAKTFGYKGKDVVGYRRSSTRVKDTKELKQILQKGEKQMGEE